MTTRRSIRKMRPLLVPAIVCVGLAFAGTSAQAATLTEGVFHIIGSSNAPASNSASKGRR